MVAHLLNGDMVILTTDLSATASRVKSGTHRTRKIGGAYDSALQGVSGVCLASPQCIGC